MVFIKTRIFKYLIFICVFLFALALLFVFYYKKESGKVCFKESCFEVELAKSNSEIEKGLMFRQNLDQDKGMLFIFKRENKHPFWMKNTLIPLDIIWIDKNSEVVFINKNSQPCQSDPCFTIIPTENAKYVLELNAGIADKIGLKVGVDMVFYGIIN